jgi:hypothetical protein
MLNDWPNMLLAFAAGVLVGSWGVCLLVFPTLILWEWRKGRRGDGKPCRSGKL